MYRPSNASERQKRIYADVEQEFHDAVLFVANATNKPMRELVIDALQGYFKTAEVKNAVDEYMRKQQEEQHQKLAKYRKVA